MGGLKIAIIGAGPAGCTLARLLIRAGVTNVTIFEAESASDIRAQGGTLDLHTDTGLAALKKAGLFDEFLKYARFDGEALVFADKSFKKYVSIGGGTSAKDSRGRPEIDRGQLRMLLLDSLPDGTIRWNHRLRSVSDDDFSLHFHDGGVEKGFDLVVGADGAWSKVRPLLTKDKPYYSGVACFDLRVSNVKERFPDLYKLVNRGSLFSYSDGRGILAQQKGDGSLLIYAMSRRDEDWKESSGYDVHDSKAVKEALAKEYNDWAPELVKFTQVFDEQNVSTISFYMLPVGNRWDNRPGVALLGDAAHLMTPFAGEGVNLAMEDAMKLAEAIIGAEKEGGKDALTERVKAYEEDMFKRAALTQKRTKQNMEDMMFTEGAPRSVVERYLIRNAIKTEYNPVSTFFLGIIVYVYFFWFKLFH